MRYLSHMFDMLGHIPYTHLQLDTQFPHTLFRIIESHNSIRGLLDTFSTVQFAGCDVLPSQCSDMCCLLDGNRTSNLCRMRLELCKSGSMGYMAHRLNRLRRNLLNNLLRSLLRSRSTLGHNAYRASRKHPGTLVECINSFRHPEFENPNSMMYSQSY